MRYPLAVLAATTAAAALVLTGCAPQPSERDTAALRTLAAVAGPTSGVAEEDISRTECWLPSAHLITDESAPETSWRVLCRVHWNSGPADRYQDTTCIGDFVAEPMLTECYRWTYYDQMPTFDDAEAVSAG